MNIVSNNIKNFNASDTVNFYVKFDNLIDNSLYTCKVFFINSSNKIEFTCAEDNIDLSKFNLNLTIAQTQNLIYGTYDVYIKLTKDDSSYSDTVQLKTIKINQNILTISASADITHAQKTLKILEDLIENKISTSDVQSYSIAGRSISKMNFSEILKWRDYYKKEVESQNSIKKYGKNVENKIRIDYIGKGWK